ERLARLVLGGVGDGLGLDISFEGEARYRLRGTPMLEVHAVAVRQPGEAEPLLSASRVLVALPWSSLRTRAEPLALERIELDAPVLDLPRLQAWLALRPTGGGGLPSLSEGVTVRDGCVLADGWEVRDLQLRLPGFRAGAPLAAHARGSLFLASPARIHFDLQLAESRPANGTGIGVQGRVNVEHADWSL